MHERMHEEVTPRSRGHRGACAGGRIAMQRHSAAVQQFGVDMDVATVAKVKLEI